MRALLRAAGHTSPNIRLLTTMKPTALITRLALLLPLLLPATAQSLESDEGFYLTGLFGVVAADDWQRIKGNVQGIVGAAPTSDNPKAIGGSVALGYRVNRYFAVEGAYVKGGDTTIEFSQLPLTFHSRHQFSAFNLVGILPLSDRAEIYGKLGHGFWKLESDFLTGGTLLLHDEVTGDDTTLGIGTAYRVMRHLDLVGDYSRIKMEVPNGYLSMDHYFFGLRLHAY